METKTGKVVSVTTKVKRDGSGEYYLVVTEVGGTVLPQHMCFDKKVAGMKAGESLTFTSNEKEGRWFMNFPKDGERKVYGAGQSGGKRDDAYAKINGILQTHTMTMSYAKDIVVALINNGILTEGGNPLAKMLEFSRALHAEITSGVALQAALGIKGVPAQGARGEVSAEGSARSNFTKDVRGFITGLAALGWVLPDNAEPMLFSRLSQGKDKDNRPIPGKPRVSDMTDADVQVAYERFKLFQHMKCPGDPRGCKYYKPFAGQKTEGTLDHFCSWTTHCYYVKNSTGRGE